VGTNVGSADGLDVGDPGVKVGDNVGSIVGADDGITVGKGVGNALS